MFFLRTLLNVFYFDYYHFFFTSDFYYFWLIFLIERFKCWRVCRGNVLGRIVFIIHVYEYHLQLFFLFFFFWSCIWNWLVYMWALEQMLGDEIGKGAYARVYKGLDLENGDFVAIKQVSLENIAQEDLNIIMVYNAF